MSSHKISTLFTNVDRKDEIPKPYGESSFSYLNRSARVEAYRIRHIMEAWYKEYVDTTEDLLRRFQSADEIPHRSASFELYLHQLLRSLGYSTNIHPETKGLKDTRPDFLANSSRESFYIEGVLSVDSSREEEGVERRKAVLYDQIERLENRNFFLLLNIRGKPTTQPSGKKLRAALEAWLNTLEPDAIIQQDDRRVWPTCEWNHEDWHIVFTALPRSPKNRGRKDMRIIGSFFPEGRFLSTWESVRDTVIKKGNDYGEIDAPLVVAANVISSHLDRIDEMQALFGQEQFIFQADPDIEQKEPEFKRAPNGVWFGPEGPRYSRISAVMMFRDLHPWTFGIRSVTTYLNPWAKLPIDGALLKLNYAKAGEEGKMRWHKVKEPYEILGLPSGWPVEY